MFGQVRKQGEGQDHGVLPICMSDEKFWTLRSQSAKMGYVCGNFPVCGSCELHMTGF